MGSSDFNFKLVRHAVLRRDIRAIEVQREVERHSLQTNTHAALKLSFEVFIFPFIVSGVWNSLASDFRIRKARVFPLSFPCI